MYEKNLSFRKENEQRSGPTDEKAGKGAYEACGALAPPESRRTKRVSHICALDRTG